MSAAQWMFSSWRQKLKVVSVLALLAVVLHQYEVIQRLTITNTALRVERRRAAEAVLEVVAALQ